MKRLLIVTSNAGDPNPQDLARAGRGLGMKVDLIEYRDISAGFEKGKALFYTDRVENLSSYEGYILRGAGEGTNWFFTHRGILADYLLEQGKRVLNGNYFSSYRGGTNKLIQTYMFVKEQIPHIPTTVYGSVETAMEKLIELPLVMKNMIGSRGEAVRFVTKKKEARACYEEMDCQNVMVQPLLPGAVDYRVIVLGGKVLGVMKRQAPVGSRLTNISAGGIPTNHEVTGEFSALAVRAAEVFDLEYAGIDLMYDEKGDLKVIEVNSGAEFQGFARVTGIDVAKEVVEYLRQGLR